MSGNTAKGFVRWTLVSFACLFALPACSCSTPIEVRGSTRGSVTFVVSGLRALMSVTVSRRDFTGGWVDEWQAEGESDAREVVYGQAPAGWVTRTTSAALHAKGVYSVTITTAGGWFGPATCPGQLLFTFTDAGVVKTCDSLQACLAAAGLSG